MGEVEYFLKGERSGNRHKQAGVSSRENAENNKHKAVDVLEGILKGILADKVINKKEIGFIHDYLKRYADIWPQCPLTGVFLCVRDEIKEGKIGKKQIGFISDAIEKIRSSRRTFLNDLDPRVDQLQGIIKGILSDNALNEKEISYLKGWIKDRTRTFGDPDIELGWPLCEIKKEFNRLEKGKGTPEGTGLLLSYLKTIIGIKNDQTLLDSTSSDLPVDDPPPQEIVLKKTTFTLTGMFKLGARSEIVEKIKSLGGHFKSEPSEGCVLVIGGYASRDWKFSSYGNKIKKAVEIRNATKKIKIITEEHFKRLLG